ncbi:MAG: Hsp70 family protein [Chloroflexi bacterium]|nr:Hsp70 family protein [Chloroflexota bacterium]
MMSQVIALDFGTTNSVVARWSEQSGAAEVLALPGLSAPGGNGRPPIIPSLLYVHDGRTGQVTAGQAVIEQELQQRAGQRLFRNFKRGIVTAAGGEPRQLDGAPWADADAGRHFIRRLLQALPGRPEEVGQLVLTAPIVSFESYLAWLNQAMQGLGTENVQIVDESTAAALGYAVTQPGALVLVFDFGGGTLDLSLVQLPQSRERAGGFLRRLLGSQGRHYTARVIAKAGQVIGGSDVDRWLLDHVLQQAGLDRETAGPALLAHCEQAKIALSTAGRVEISLAAAGRQHSVTVSRGQLEALLADRGFYDALHRLVERVLQQARRQGVFKEDIQAVLMVGGVSLMPSVQQLLGQLFEGLAMRADKPFTAVAEGALQMAAGFGLEDSLVHSYGLRHLDPETNRHRYEEIIPAGSRYPSQKPVELLLGAAHPGQEEIEFVVAQLVAGSISQVDVVYENGQAVFVSHAGGTEQQILPLLAEGQEALFAPLQPPGRPGQDRLKAEFTVDARRHLHLTVTDLDTHQPLLTNVFLGTLH